LATVGERLVSYFRTQGPGALQFSLNTTNGRHQAFYISRRAPVLSSFHPTWENEPDLTSFKARFVGELTKIKDLLGTLLSTRKTPGALGGPVEGGGTSTPNKAAEFAADPTKHLDLNDVGFLRTDDTDKVASHTTRDLLKVRRKSVNAIIWRGLAIHGQEIWKDGDNVFDFETEPLHELIDRRLRAVERMSGQVSDREFLGTVLIPAPPNTPTGPWIDHYRVRPFEYPRIEKAAGLTGIKQAIGVGNILGAGSPAFQETGPDAKPWQFQDGNQRLNYNVPPEPGLHLRQELQNHWVVLPPPAGDKQGEVVLNPTLGVTAAQAVALMMRGKFDWWDRSWLFCDHVLCALHVDALAFALNRRNGGSDTEFNNLATNGFIHLVPNLKRHGKQRLMADGPKDKYFENTEITPAELQVGDHITFHNSALHNAVVNDEWGIENAFVVEIESDISRSANSEFSDGIKLKDMKVQGHGIPPKRVTDYVEDLRKELDKLFIGLQGVATGPNGIRQFEGNAVIVRWEPFSDPAKPNTAFKGKGAWWIKIATDKERGWVTASDIKNELPRVIIASDVTGQPNLAFPFPAPPDEAALYPLYEPKGVDWIGYLNGRGKPTNPLYVTPPALTPARARKDDIPGIGDNGVNAKIPVIRMTVRRKTP
jgi:hypothetical protein